MKTVVIIGGGAGGMTSAVQVRKQDPDARVVVFEKTPYVAWAGCPMPYFISGKLSEMSVIHYPPKYFRDERNIEVYVNHEAVFIDFDERFVSIKGEEINGDFGYDFLVLSLGASAFIPPIKGIDKDNFPDGVFVLRNPLNAFSIKEYIGNQSPRKAVIIGAGLVGMEMAEAFTELGLEVTIVEKMEEILPFIESSMQRRRIEKVFKMRNINLLTGISVSEVIIENDKIRGAVLSDGRRLDTDLLLISIGIRPNIGLLEISKYPFDADKRLIPNENMETAVSGVYALGDMVWSKNLLTGQYVYAAFGDVADKQGIVAGNNIAGGNLKFRGVIGSISSSFFELQIAKTGLTLKEAKEAGFDAESVSVKSLARVIGFEGTTAGAVNVVYDKSSMTILGASIVADECASQFIDQFAIAITHRIPVEEIINIDFAYSPSTSVVWNPMLAAYRKILDR
jgi:NADPH-dependent 2,4-dienoyl-CoA reductase/sulfur reductase-like enzyme